MLSTVKKASVFIILASGFFIIGSFSAHAQQSAPQFLITWHANTYVPSNYTGKALPGAYTQITASFELLSGGKLLNLTGQTIYWYLNGNFLDNGTGKQTAIFNAPAATPDTETLEVQLPNYKGGLLVRDISIPIVDPEVVIEAPFANGSFSGNSATLHATPYFFGVTSPLELTYVWDVNGITAKNSENPQDLTIQINSGAATGANINTTLNVSNPKRIFEIASANKSLIYAK